MKKIIPVLLVIIGLAMFTNVQAQNATLMPLVAGDTLSASASLDTVQKVISVTAGYSALGIQVVATKLSGTVVGKAYLYSSLDGTNYILTDSSSAFANQTTNTAFFTKVTTPYTKYRVDVRSADGSATTQSVKIRVYYVARKHD